MIVSDSLLHYSAKNFKQVTQDSVSSFVFVDRSKPLSLYSNEKLNKILRTIQNIWIYITYYFGSLIFILVNLDMSKTPFGFRSVCLDYIFFKIIYLITVGLEL